MWVFVYLGVVGWCRLVMLLFYIVIGTFVSLWVTVACMALDLRHAALRRVAVVCLMLWMRLLILSILARIGRHILSVVGN